MQKGLKLLSGNSEVCWHSAWLPKLQSLLAVPGPGHNPSANPQAGLSHNHMHCCCCCRCCWLCTAWHLHTLQIEHSYIASMCTP